MITLIAERISIRRPLISPSVRPGPAFISVPPPTNSNEFDIPVALRLVEYVVAEIPVLSRVADIFVALPVADDETDTPLTD